MLRNISEYKYYKEPMLLDISKYKYYLPTVKEELS